MASFSLEKGGSFNLSKQTDNLTKIFVGGGWDVTEVDGGPELDLDLFAVIVDANGQHAAPSLIFYGNKGDENGPFFYPKDNRSGEGEGDDESINIDLTKVDENVQKIIIGINIYQAAQRDQSFKSVENAFIRVVSTGSGTDDEKVRYDLPKSETGVTFIAGELAKTDGNWIFTAEDRKSVV